MCGRYASFLPAEAIARIFGTNRRRTWRRRGTSHQPTIAPWFDAIRHPDLLAWGLLPYWTKEPAEARRPINAPTAAESGARSQD